MSARLAFVVVFGTCVVMVVIMFVLLILLLTPGSYTPLYAAGLPDTIDPRGMRGK